MTLDEYLSEPDRSAKELAVVLGIPDALLSQWRTKKRPVPIERCPAIERATNGEVSRRDLRPDDWHLIWPELVTDQFPAPVATQEDRRTDTSPPHVMAEKRKAELIDKKDS